MKKKTYVFDNATLEVLQTLREELGKKETQIIREALRLYLDNHRTNGEVMNSLNKLVERIENVVERVSELSYKLGRCEERTKRLEEEIRKLRGER
ncbi:hypothetical protein BCF55_0343 [Hydrogenivirga caldilitoris]|uniref:Ribbon-helix-helix CopG family protein n=1 Tax=Hydrogenivirga caldilitoris TaxID=246264 RepID=A0A497XP90_9AQUI|nr:hypothetical protein [Hydrogenivirga caldilitoris]RLJ70081.1 hypothetical protein BCF55_0343 [Hydrogenivirga caldilitoris]